MPECGYCKDCKWWGSNRPSQISVYFYTHGTLRECERARGEGADAVHEDSKAVAVDGDAYHAFLMTEPDFGCLMFEPKT